MDPRNLIGRPAKTPLSGPKVIPKSDEQLPPIKRITDGALPQASLPGIDYVEAGIRTEARQPGAVPHGGRSRAINHGPEPLDQIRLDDLHGNRRPENLRGWSANPHRKIMPPPLDAIRLPIPVYAGSGTRAHPSWRPFHSRKSSSHSAIPPSDDSQTHAGSLNGRPREDSSASDSRRASKKQKTG